MLNPGLPSKYLDPAGTFIYVSVFFRLTTHACLSDLNAIPFNVEGTQVTGEF